MKRRLLGWMSKGFAEIESMEPVLEFEPLIVDDALVERLAERVHQAWMAEKQRQGFADHPVAIVAGQPGCCDQPAFRHHPDMVPYSQLSEATKEYDRATVRAVLWALGEA